MLDFGNIKESFFGEPSYSNGSAYSDLDNDGDLDLIVNNINSIASILENKSSKENKSLTIELKNNKAIKGSKVTVFKSNNKVDVKEILKILVNIFFNFVEKFDWSYILFVFPVLKI